MAAEGSKKVSNNAISRVVAMQEAELNAARMMLKPAYNDWFYDYTEKGKGNPFHEYFLDVIIGGPFEEIAFTPDRMNAVNTLKTGASYSDFFVEGSGSWHEAIITDAGAEELRSNESARMAAVSKSNVLRAYALLKAGAFSK